MNGHIRPGRQAGTWYLRVEQRRESGKRRQRRETFRGTKAEARRRLRALLHEAETNVLADGSRLTVAMLFETWLESRRHRVAATTFGFYSTLVRLYLIPEIGSLKAEALHPTHIERAIASWIRGARKDRVEGRLSLHSVKHIFGTGKSAYRWAVQMRYLARNPFDGVTPPRVERREMRALDPAGVVELLQAAAGTDLRLPILLAVGTGLRRGELLGLRWSDLDLQVGRLTVRRSLEFIDGSIRTKSTKTVRSSRTIALASLLVDALRKHRAEQIAPKRARELGEGDDAWLFQTITGGPWNPVAFTKRFGRFVRRSGLQHLRFHDLRHSHATLSLAAGTDLKTISAALGHSTIAITANTYLHAVEVLHSEAAGRLDDLLRGALATQSVPQRCHTEPAGKKKARRSGLSMVAGLGFEPRTFGL